VVKSSIAIAIDATDSPGTAVEALEARLVTFSVGGVPRKTGYSPLLRV